MNTLSKLVFTHSVPLVLRLLSIMFFAPLSLEGSLTGFIPAMRHKARKRNASTSLLVDDEDGNVKV